MYLGSDKATDVSHIAEQESTALISNGTELAILPIARIGAATTNDHARAEVEGLLLKLPIVNEASGGVNLVGQAFKVDGGSRDLLTTRSVIAMGKVATRGQI